MLGKILKASVITLRINGDPVGDVLVFDKPEEIFSQLRLFSARNQGRPALIVLTDDQGKESLFWKKTNGKMFAGQGYRSEVWFFDRPGAGIGIMTDPPANQ